MTDVGLGEALPHSDASVTHVSATQTDLAAAAPSCIFTVSDMWDGSACECPSATVRIDALMECLQVTIDAPFFDSTPPPAGSLAGHPQICDGLWDYEVVELFVCQDNGDDDMTNCRYLELEFSPHGKYLALQLLGQRNPAPGGTCLPLLSFTATIDLASRRWTGVAQVPYKLLPLPTSLATAPDASAWPSQRLQATAVQLRTEFLAARLRCNAYAIHGDGATRVYRSQTAVPGPQPDFHRLAFFPVMHLRNRQPP
jgi:hypothetical protein